MYWLSLLVAADGKVHVLEGQRFLVENRQAVHAGVFPGGYVGVFIVVALGFAVNAARSVPDLHCLCGHCGILPKIFDKPSIATEKTFNGLRISGFLALFLILALSGLSSYLIAGINETWSVITGIVGLCLLAVCLLGLMEIEPNNARVMLFFGKYKGTITDNGFFWVNPLYSKKKITLRARNLDVPPIKVNDKVGNPVMIGAVMVWKVKDTYRAMFDIDSSSISISSNKSFISMGESSELSQRMQNYENFVQIQSDAAIRKIAGMYAYDYNESKDPVTLRSDDGEVAQKLEEELNSRLAIAGIEVLEARINYLAYASEIAGVMLRRQQAEAIIAARERIVEGAVSMVQLALNKLDKDNVVELDEERKAAMVSNLLVVLCADEAAQPVVNTGTLHH